MLRSSPRDAGGVTWSCSGSGATSTLLEARGPSSWVRNQWSVPAAALRLRTPHVHRVLLARVQVAVAAGLSREREPPAMATQEYCAQDGLHFARGAIVPARLRAGRSGPLGSDTAIGSRVPFAGAW